jgi:hypothetical protein
MLMASWCSVKVINMLAVSYMGEKDVEGIFWTREGKMTNGDPEPSLEIYTKNHTLSRKLKAEGWDGLDTW